MVAARKTIHESSEILYEKALKKLDVYFPLTLVLYVGLGRAAGLATRFKGSPSILLELQKIADLGWHTKSKLQGLIAHEIGHLAHAALRKDWEYSLSKDPLLMLYNEGFAQGCEHFILEREIWHQAQGHDWLSWCKSNEAYLANQYLDRLKSKSGVQDFFGSSSMKGRSETGYFLGHQFIQLLEADRSLREIALLDVKDARNMVIGYLRCAAQSR
jgi:hypothetical protein